MRIEQRGRVRAGRLHRGAQRPGDQRDHRLDPIHEQFALGLRIPQLPGRPAHIPGVGQRLDGPQERGAVQRSIRGAVRNVPSNTAGVDARELARVVGEQALRHEL